ncbi:hypothetical protein D9619_001689 [Psilocybe cf. subviscida]|uniref:Arrestin C-terminal-like domain-containing protein n=1 Tax=Psilocybe cf. subviscida TaxID=2480587 RepID=A0A8H5BE04_9AGAR|nr:hypothetical protein D9619_001689 [Psilocybe cf. subviscida]
MVSDSKKAKQSSQLTIRLTESAVFLPTDGIPTRRGSTLPDPRNAVLRGLLILELVKPTKITSIDVELTAVTSTAWPEGIGARRIDVTEEHRVFYASTTFFNASKAHPTRRTASIGPGVALSGINDSPYIDDEDVFADEDAYLHTESHILDTHMSRSRSRGGGTGRHHRLLGNLRPHAEEPQAGPSNYAQSAFVYPNRPAPVQHDTSTSSQWSFPEPRPNANRRMSIDTGQLRPTSVYESYHHESPLGEELPPIPPYSPHPESPASSGLLGSPVTPAQQSLDEFRDSLHSSLRSMPVSQSQSSMRSGSPADASPSQVPAEFETRPHSPYRNARSGSASQSRPRPAEPNARSSPVPTPPDQTERGRKGSRFSLSAVSTIFMDVVRSSSPKTAWTTEHDQGRLDGAGDLRRRGRTVERDEIAGRNEGSRPLESKERGRGMISKILYDKPKDKAGDKVKSDGWKEFKAGTYTYPISFSIPSTAPPTMACDYGTVTWRLKANVHRPGAFKPRLTAVRDVITIACPTEEDTEDSENILVERHWEQQLQYLISISGRSFFIGGTIPVTLTLMPLAKLKIYKLSVYVEERVDYYTNMRRIARTDPITRYCLLSVKNEGKMPAPLLPLDSECTDALRSSPLYTIVDHDMTDSELSEAASSLMGPGPWTFHKDLQLPQSCDQIHFTNRNRRSNVIVTHTLKVVMRVERGDDLYIDKHGKRKMFDIVVQTPIFLLSCRCNPEWVSLPRYSELLEDSPSIVPICPCQVTKQKELRENPPGFRTGSVAAALERITSRHSSDSSMVSTAETSPLPHTQRSLRQHSHGDSILRSNYLFERLVSGQETESGETPPPYDAASRLLPIVEVPVPGPSVDQTSIS